ncbi:daptide-type RiPP [Saccharibacillus brassicae]|nr:daptide-type RiPP [Saccharibacillus brassicae]
MEQANNLNVEELEMMDTPGWAEIATGFAAGVAVGGVIVALT